MMPRILTTACIVIIIITHTGPLPVLQLPKDSTSGHMFSLLLCYEHPSFRCLHGFLLQLLEVSVEYHLIAKILPYILPKK